MRKNLAQDFDEIYVLDLGGNVRRNPKLSGSTHNVFGIQVGMSISFFVAKIGADRGPPSEPCSAGHPRFPNRTKSARIFACRQTGARSKNTTF